MNNVGLPPSCPDLFRVSTFFYLVTTKQLVDGRDKPGHDVTGAPRQDTRAMHTNFTDQDTSVLSRKFS